MPTSSRQPMLRELLEPWCAAGVTGALRILDPPGGVVYIVDGRVAYAECPVASGLERLLTASGRLPAEAWRAAVNAGRAQHRIGPELVDGGLVSQPELEALGVMALYDAAFFLFDLVVGTQFEHRARHPVGHLRTLDLRVVCQEVDRRKRLLADAWPDAAIDTAAVLPQRRLRSQCVALTALQWEVVANADRRRSPVDLARLLGRDTFSVMLEVRRMARSGLVEPGRPGGSAAAESVATVRARAAAGLPTTPEAERVGRHARPAPEHEPLPEPEPEQVDTSLPPPVLPHRAVRHQPSAEFLVPAGMPAEPRVSEQILVRLLAGLGAL
ncbi:hypothetical protein [Catellatospora bangladeshensis]|nr:hypothetical protein [Catellatospora bangladeshensis]